MSAISCAALVVAALLSSCGGGHSDHTSSSSPRPQSSNTPATTRTATSPAPGAYWPYAKLIASLAGRTVTVSNATVRLDPALVECNGDGAVRRTGSTREWGRYTCTQTTFLAGGDHDVTFDVVILGATQLSIRSPRTGPE